MKYPRVESGDARLLVRSLGLLLNQASVYGPVHNVTRSATARVYKELYESLERYGTLEFSVKSNLVCVNGWSEDLDASLSSNLVRRFAQLDISGILMTPPLPPREFEKVVNILSMPIAQITESGGVGILFEREQIRAVSVVKVDYRRVEHGDTADDDLITLLKTPADEDRFGSDDPATGATQRIRTAESVNSSGGVIDLSEELEEEELTYSAFGLPSPDEKRAEERRIRRDHSMRLAELLRKTAESLEANMEDNPKVELGRVLGALEQVRMQLMEMSRGSENAISSLAREVDADKLTVAGLEADARRRGFPLKLTREELLERYAELNQEIIQPLTVSTGVIEMLRKEQAGIVSESQQELLRMAHESIDRVNQLVNYMHGVTGLPHSFDPDTELITDSYRFHDRGPSSRA